MVSGTLRYWAGARAAAGVESERFRAVTLAEALDEVRARHGPEFARILSICSFLVDAAPVGLRPHDTVVLPPGVTVEVLPPFAGGAESAQAGNAATVPIPAEPRQFHTGGAA